VRVRRKKWRARTDCNIDGGDKSVLRQSNIKHRKGIDRLNYLENYGRKEEGEGNCFLGKGTGFVKDHPQENSL